MQTLTQAQRDWDTKVFAQIQQASEGHHPQLSRYVQELLAYSGFSRPTTVIPYDPQGPSGWVRATENSIEWACSWPIIDLDHLFVLAHEVFHVLQANSLEVMRSCPQKLLELEAEMFAYQFVVQAKNRARVMQHRVAVFGENRATTVRAEQNFPCQILQASHLQSDGGLGAPRLRAVSVTLPVSTTVRNERNTRMSTL